MSAIRLVLNEAQTAALVDNARFSVVVVHPGSWPTNPGRMLLDLIETDSATANAVTAILSKAAKKNALAQPPAGDTPETSTPQ